MSGVPTAWLVVIFLAGTAATWQAGIRLSKSTDALDKRFSLGDAVGGTVLLAFAGTLPELAITVAAAAQGELGLAAGNLIGGIAMQTMVLAVCDFAVGSERPLTYLAGSLTPVLEALFVVLVTAIAMMGALLPESTAIGGVVSPASLVISVFWLGGVVALNRLRNNPHLTITAPGSHPGRRRHTHSAPGGKDANPYRQLSSRRLELYFGLACAVTLVAGVALELSAETLASRAGINGVIFGATFLALATALPEISSGLGSVRLGDNALAIGDIFGGNAFQLCLFLLADLIAGMPVLPAAGRLNSWLAALGIAVTAVYAGGLVVRPERCIGRLGPDSLLAIVIFIAGLVGVILLPT
jgi:cation:H+ antiporter